MRLASSNAFWSFRLAKPYPHAGVAMNGRAKTRCVAFLHWALPRMGLAWPGFQRVYRQVCKRIRRRLQELDLPDFATYQAYLEGHPSEWGVLASLCRISISRFYRDAAVFDALGDEILPQLLGSAREDGRAQIRCWSAGCASGEEPYSLAMLYSFRLAPRFSRISLEISATDADTQLLERAARACYRRGSLRELPCDWIDIAFERQADLLCLRPAWRRHVSFRCHDIREPSLSDSFDLILCRNLAFTYFDDEQRRAVLRHLLRALRPAGALVIGRTETLPEDVPGILPWLRRLGVYRKAEA